MRPLSDFFALGSITTAGLELSISQAFPDLNVGVVNTVSAVLSLAVLYACNPYSNNARSEIEIILVGLGAVAHSLLRMFLWSQNIDNIPQIIIATTVVVTIALLPRIGAMISRVLNQPVNDNSLIANFAM